MIPFHSISGITIWWRENARDRACSVLFDLTDIKKGIQRREIHQPTKYAPHWHIGFPESGSVHQEPARI